MSVLFYYHETAVELLLISCFKIGNCRRDQVSKLISLRMFGKNDPRPRYNTKVLKESFDRENRRFRIHDVFNPSLKAAPITGKFYSKYYGTDLNRGVDAILLERIRAYQVGTPNQKYPAPVTENQRYGWIPVQLVPLRKGDVRYYAPRLATISKFMTVPHAKKK